MKTVLVFGIKNMVGGIETYLLAMQQELCKEIKFLYVIEGYRQEEFIYSEKILKNNGVLVTIPDRHHMIHYFSAVKKLLRRFGKKGSTVYFNIDHISFDIFAVNMAYSLGLKVVIHSHNAGIEPLESRMRRIIHGIMESYGIRRLKNVNVTRLAVSHKAGDYLFCEKPFTIISPGIDVKKYVGNTGSRIRIRKQLSCEDAVLIGMIGRLAPVKNPLFAVDIVCALQKMAKCKLIFCGDGPMMDEIRGYGAKCGVENIVIMRGNVENLEEYLQAMDVVIAPSLSEGMSIVLMEAQAAGVPCVCSKGRFPKEIQCTELIHQMELEAGADAWADKIMEIMEEYNLDKRLSYNSIVCKSEFNIHRAASRLKTVFKESSI